MLEARARCRSRRPRQTFCEGPHQSERMRQRLAATYGINPSIAVGQGSQNNHAGTGRLQAIKAIHKPRTAVDASGLASKALNGRPLSRRSQLTRRCRQARDGWSCDLQRMLKRANDVSQISPHYGA